MDVLAEARSEPLSVTLVGLARRAALLAAVGVLLGVAAACPELAANGYAGLGFRRSIALVLWDAAAGAAALGALLAMLLVALRDALGRRSAGAQRWLAPEACERLTALRGRPLLRFALAAGALAAGGLWWLAPGVGAGRLHAALAEACVVVAAALLSGALANALAARLQPKAGARRTAFFAACGAALATALGAWLLVRPTSAAAALAVAGLLAAVFAVVHSGVLALRDEAHRGWLALAPLALLALAGLASPWLEAPTLAARRPTNVVLIGIDTLRLDHTSLFRTDARGVRLTPRLAALARDAVLYRNATSQAPWTLPAFASVLTGRYPRAHGAISFDTGLPADALTLAEVLREAGYRTTGVVGHVFLNRAYGLSQGFEEYDESQILGEHAVSAPAITDAAIAQLERRDERPFFLFAHYFDPHYEYRDHAGFDFSDAYRGALRGAPLAIESLRERRAQLGARDLEHLRDRYDEEIAFTDREIGRLLDFLEARGLLDDTIVAVVSDHGEEFMERGWLGHTISLHEELLRVPLLLRPAGGATLPGVVESAVETRALYATLLAELGIDVEPAAAGAVLPLEPGSQASRQPVFAGVWLAGAPADSGKRVEQTSVRVGRWKLIEDHLLGRVRLFDLEADPGETRDLAASGDTAAGASKRRELGALLERWRSVTGAEARAAPARSLDADEVERLKALGYL